MSDAVGVNKTKKTNNRAAGAAGNLINFRRLKKINNKKIENTLKK